MHLSYWILDVWISDFSLLGDSTKDLLSNDSTKTTVGRDENYSAVLETLGLHQFGGLPQDPSKEPNR